MPSSKDSSGAPSTQEFVEKLRSALRRDGDFPASAKVVGELRMLVTNPKTSANQVTEVILREPSLGTRVLSLVNSPFYRRAKPIMTVSQAVLQIGMKQLAELCAGLVLMQKFVPQARRGGPFATCLQKIIVTSLVASSITTEQTRATGGKNNETGYLAGSFSEIGTLLLAYYFPQVYETAIKRSQTKNQDIKKSIAEIIGLSPIELSMEVLNALDMPAFYKDSLKILKRVDSGENIDPKTLSPELASTLQLATAVNAAQKISSAVVTGKGVEELDSALGSIKDSLGLDKKSLNSIMGGLPDLFKNHCTSLELPLPSLPDYVQAYAKTNKSPSSTNIVVVEQDRFAQYVDEIRQAVESREPTASVITSVMETLAWSLGFDRVLLLLLGPGKKKLVGRMLLGKMEDFDPKTYEKALIGEVNYRAPDVMAYKESRPVFVGEPIFAGAWPLAAIPVGFGSKAIGVIYADKAASSGSTDGLTEREQAAIGVLGELLDKSVMYHSA